jgi:hypothetical protein
MTVNELIKKLQQMVQEEPSLIDKEVIYSRDDEGNAFHKLSMSYSGTMEVENLDEYYLTPIDEDGIEVFCIN